MLEHGGRLRTAAQRYDIPLADWLDLSTGIAPYGWSLPSIPASAWGRLPEPGDGLEAAAQRYYGARSLLPLAGSQAAIQALPRLRRQARVGVVSPCYAEHAEAWRRAGHRLVELCEASVPGALDRLDVLVVVNPNNPTGRLIAAEQLLQWHARLAASGGWLLVDEAFMDCTPQHSLAAHSHLPGLVVLRSFGKFFGLAGARLGFALAHAELLRVLEELLGPWAIGGPARWLGSTLLADDEGQQRQRRRLNADGARLAALLAAYGLPPVGGCALFQTVFDVVAEPLYEHLAYSGILTRLFMPFGLRFGLPGEEAGWARLEQALRCYREQHS
ncbi:threonine-phosphate decarboxylase [Stutzerimonas stutzeri]|uniref:threonine-phosphate decarboxylase n=1 Tax=Stutzerimonas stutzeri TaxID=316 RepID=A0A2N8T6B1_STUST|nr:threonine-phosphate decarboxylase CobD [Stutzerimonas stutzeri]MCQ4325511.1 threonine-phosphate decarboxylase CobD [Stutzerimonas stutzeri]PNG10268.1 threonine-phosphate decarboxylase [Stutzerimonas stutzeri]